MQVGQSQVKPQTQQPDERSWPRELDGSLMSNIQYKFIFGLYKDKTHVSVYLVNGIKLQGSIDSFDENVIFLCGSNRIAQMIYKQAIATIVPSK